MFWECPVSQSSSPQMLLDKKSRSLFDYLHYSTVACLSTQFHVTCPHSTVALSSRLFPCAPQPIIIMAWQHHIGILDIVAENTSCPWGEPHQTYTHLATMPPLRGSPSHPGRGLTSHLPSPRHPQRDEKPSWISWLDRMPIPGLKWALLGHGPYWNRMPYSLRWTQRSCHGKLHNFIYRTSQVAAHFIKLNQ